MKQGYFFFFVLLLILTGCGEQPPEKVTTQGPSIPEKGVFLPTILKNQKLNVLLENSLTSYFVYKGQPMGFDYDLLSKFTNHLGVRLHIQIDSDFTSITSKLNKGDYHVAAGNYTITTKRKELISFSSPLTNTNQVLVQRYPDNYKKLTAEQRQKALVKDPIKLVDYTVYVDSSSSFMQRLQNLETEMGVHLNIESSTGESTEELIEKVALGDIDFTVADKNVALVNQLFFSNIDVNTPISFTQRIAWLLPKGESDLQDTLNAWLEDFKKTTEYAVIYNKYFKYRSLHRERVNTGYTLIDSGAISPFDDLFKHEANKINWDWKVIAAQCFTESKFDANAISWTGASGLMQIMPTTAAQYGLDSNDLFNPELNLKAAVKHLKELENFWLDRVSDSTERTKFILASYNAGLGHVKDAIRLAKAFEKDTAIWDNHVAIMLENKSKPDYYRHEVVKHGYCRGSEPVNYVLNITDRYKDYSNFIKD